MAAKITFFPVDNGDMTLLRLADSKAISLLIDCKIRSSADGPDDLPPGVAKTLSLMSGGTKKHQDDLPPGVAKTLSLMSGGTKKHQDDLPPDVAKALRDRLKKDANKRPYVDAMLLSHPDKDHCLGLKTHFWLGPLSDYLDDDKPQDEKRIIIRQIWSSPMVFRRASANHSLCDDAKAFNREAKRRIKVNKNSKFPVKEGDRILIIGEDQDGKTDDLASILVKAGEKFKGVNQVASEYITSYLFAPIGKQDDETEGKLSKNNSSVIIGFRIKNSASGDGVSRFLSGGDAGVEIWERISDEYSVVDLGYDLLLAPHHCSWGTLSYDSWSHKGEDAKVSLKAKKALGQARYGAIIVSSSKPVVDDKNDPPCIRAKREYCSILGDLGKFKCTGGESTKAKPAPLEFETTKNGSFRLATCVTANT